MNTDLMPFAVISGCLFIAVGFGTGLSCIGDGIKAIAKVLKESLQDEDVKSK